MDAAPEAVCRKAGRMTNKQAIKALKQMDDDSEDDGSRFPADMPGI